MRNVLRHQQFSINLTISYDTIWRDCLLYKFLQVLPCSTLFQLLNNILSDWNFKVISRSISKQKKLNNGLPHGLVFTPVLLYLYISDVPKNIQEVCLCWCHSSSSKAQIGWTINVVFSGHLTLLVPWRPHTTGFPLAEILKTCGFWCILRTSTIIS